MSNVECGASLVEGVGDELIYTTLILGGIILFFNLYWIYLVATSRTIQATLPNDSIHSIPIFPTSNIATQENLQEHNTNYQQPLNSDSSESAEDSDDSNEEDESVGAVSSIVNEHQDKTKVGKQNICDSSTSNVSSTKKETCQANVFSSQPTTPNKDQISNIEDSDDACSSQNAPKENILNDLTIKLQFVSGLQRVVKACSEDTLGEFKRAHFNEEISSNKRVRLIMNGQELKNDTYSLKTYKICDNFVLHCLVSQQANPTTPQNVPSQPQNTLHFINLGCFLFISTGAIISLFWYARIFYATFFNVASTFSLFVLSSFYLLASIAFITPNSSENRQ